jgi:predicted Zn-dependent protease
MSLQMIRQKRSRISFLCLCCVGIVACSSISRLDESGLETLADDERGIWNRSREEEYRLKKSGQLHDSKELGEYVNSVATKLLPDTLRAQQFPLKVKIIRNPTLNAFALSHGVIYIHSGFFAKIENEAQLATILAHEISHILHRHPLQHFRRVQNMSTSLAWLNVASIRAGVYANLVSLFGALGATAAVSGYSKRMEAEADKTGLDLLVTAGYDPAEAVALFEYLEIELKERDKEQPFFFGSHPRLVERKASYTELLHSKYLGKTGHKGGEAYSLQAMPIILENVTMDIALGRWNWAGEAILKVLSAYPERPEGHYYLGEWFRLRGNIADLDKAQNAFAKASQLDPTYALAYRGLGMVYLKKDDLDSAAKQFMRYLSLLPQATDRAYLEQYILQTTKSEIQ